MFQRFVHLFQIFDFIFQKEFLLKILFRFTEISRLSQANEKRSKMLKTIKRNQLTFYLKSADFSVSILKKDFSV